MSAPIDRVDRIAKHVKVGIQRRTSQDHGLLTDPVEPGTLAFLGAPCRDGQQLHGVELAPDAFRGSGLIAAVHRLGWEFEDLGDARGEEVSEDEPRPAAREYYDAALVRNSRSIGRGIRAVYDRAERAASEGKFVLTVGGDHGIATGSIGAVLKHRPDAAVIWVDAHGDCNTPETSPSANYHGMPLAHVMGWFSKSVAGFEWLDDVWEATPKLPEDRLALIALRDVDPIERQLLGRSGVHVFTMSDIDHLGIGKVMDMALDKVDPKRRRPLHLSFDIDACDPTIAPATGTKARGGLSYREAHYICEKLASTNRLGSMDLVEVNPALDEDVPERMHGDDDLIKAQETVRLGVELVLSALGKTIV